LVFAAEIVVPFLLVMGWEPHSSRHAALSWASRWTL
jgi:hypothetical protein